MPRRLISTGSPFEKAAGYSRAVIDGDFAFVAGTTGYDYTTMVIPADVTSQARNCFKNIEAALKEGGFAMADIVRAGPDDFLVLSGDDALALALMAIGGRGLISVCSNQIPREMADLIEAAERGDFAAARAIHQRVLGLMQVNFCESNPGPVKFSMAVMGLCEEQFRLPMVPPRRASTEKVLAVMRERGLPLVTSAAA